MNKEKFFLIRTLAHIGRVKRNAKILAENYPEIADSLLAQAATHDESKFKEPEYKSYIELTWEHKCRTEGIPCDFSTEKRQEIKQATIHHIKNNKHHPEYWDDNFKDGSVRVDGTQMDSISIAEMCCDWVSMSQELQNSNSAHDWAGANINKRWNFSKEQVILIYQYLDVLQEKLDETTSSS